MKRVPTRSGARAQRAPLLGGRLYRLPRQRHFEEVRRKPQPVALSSTSPQKTQNTDVILCVPLVLYRCFVACMVTRGYARTATEHKPRISASSSDLVFGGRGGLHHVCCARRAT